MTEWSSDETAQKKQNFDLSFCEVKENVAAAAESVGKRADDIILLAATKTVPVEVINHAIRSGIKVIGENRVQELKEKHPDLDKTAEIHFIGHLQTNKVKDVVPLVSMIHSVSSLKLAKEISKQCERFNKPMDVLIEINIGNEESKSGFSAEEVEAEIEKVAALPHLSVKGLMAIPPADAENSKNIEFFNKMYQLFIDIEAKKRDNVSMEYLSMGMSQDYADAIRCGANIVRIGTTLFGNRIYKK